MCTRVCCPPVSLSLPLAFSVIVWTKMPEPHGNTQISSHTQIRFADSAFLIERCRCATPVPIEAPTAGCCELILHAGLTVPNPLLCRMCAYVSCPVELAFACLLALIVAFSLLIASFSSCDLAFRSPPLCNYNSHTCGFVALCSIILQNT